MSISTVASPPPPLAMEKNSRRVRFSLPEAKLTLHNDKRAVHGTSMYVNGTLINVTSTIHTTTDTKTTKNSIITKNEGGAFKSSLKASTPTNGSNGIPKESSQYKVTFNVSKIASSSSPPPNVMSKEPRHSLPTSTTQSNNTAMMIGRRRMSKSSNGRHSGVNTLPIIGRKSSSVEDIDEREREIEHVLPITNLNKYKSSDDLRDPSNFRMINGTKGNVLRLPEAMPYHKALKHSTMTPNVLRVPDLSESTQYERFLFFHILNSRF